MYALIFVLVLNDWDFFVVLLVFIFLLNQTQILFLMRMKNGDVLRVVALARHGINSHKFYTRKLYIG